MYNIPGYSGACCPPSCFHLIHFLTPYLEISQLIYIFVCEKQHHRDDDLTWMIAAEKVISNT
jgi:hypothetical protein